jgi:hypothetical protein
VALVKQKESGLVAATRSVKQPFVCNILRQSGARSYKFSFTLFITGSGSKDTPSVENLKSSSDRDALADYGYALRRGDHATILA